MGAHFILRRGCRALTDNGVRAVLPTGANAGKSSLAYQFVEKKFDDEYNATIDNRELPQRARAPSRPPLALPSLSLVIPPACHPPTLLLACVAPSPVAPCTASFLAFLHGSVWLLGRLQI